MKFLKKWWQLGIILLLIVAIAVLVLVGLKSIDKYKETIENQKLDMASMEDFINDTYGDGVGNMINCYIVTRSVRVGEEIQEGDLQQITIPEKIAYTEEEVQVTTQDENGKTVTNTEYQQIIDVVESLNEIDGMYYRTDMEKGTLLLKQYMLDYKIDNTERYREITFDTYPTDIVAGDYVDIVIKFSTYEEMIAIPYVKIEGIDLTNGLFKVIFTDYEESVYNSMLLDKALYPNVTISMVKYVDASAQTAAEAFYPINTNITEIMSVNPNLTTLVEQEMQLERQQLSAILGGDLSEFDEEQLDEVKDNIEQIRKELSTSLTANIKSRIKAEEQAAKEAAKNQ